MGNLASRRKINSYRNSSILLALLGIVLIISGFTINIFLAILSAVPFVISANLWNKQKTWAIGAKGLEFTRRKNQSTIIECK